MSVLDSARFCRLSHVLAVMLMMVVPPVLAQEERAQPGQEQGTEPPGHTHESGAGPEHERARADEHGAGEHAADEHGAGEHGAGEHGAGEHAADEHAAGAHGAGEHAAEAHSRMREVMTGPLGLPLEQSASGTAWQPASTPMHGHMALLGEWALMLHYQLFAGLDAQGSRRGATEAVTTNWIMGMAQHGLLGGQVTARAMLSLEALFLGPDGYPLLLQTGETSGGLPLVDRQHPHDLFMELALKLNRGLTKDLAFEVYAAPAGEPALGPAGFPHRASAHADPLAPLSHHWQDSTHILFGVLTAGAYTRHVKLEGSWFNGREPDESRYNLDLRVPDSYSVRLSLQPGENWSGQLSYGFLKEPEVVREPGESVRRLSASLTHNQRVGKGGNWATTLVWGQNRGSHGAPSNAFLLESSLSLHRHNLFVRAETVTKSAHDFGLEVGEATEGQAPDERFQVGAVAVGYIRDLGTWGGLEPGLGVRGAINVVPAGLEARYGTRVPVGAMVFVRARR